MAGEAQDKVWPLPKFYFQVQIAGQEVAFQEVSGLDIEAQVIEYRHGNSKEFSTIKMNTIERKEVVISLLDQEGSPTMVWTLKNAWPTKITGTDLKSDGNEVAVETLEVAHEGITIDNK